MTALRSIPLFYEPISLSKFFEASQAPFIIKSYASDWPAIQRWTSPEYLLRAGGVGRIVPVEVGNDYTSHQWTQKLIKWEDFLSNLSSSGSDRASDELPVLYLAQHSLFNQIPGLREDIHYPDYVYLSPPPPEYFPEYKPPSTEEQLIINAWIGPQNTVSPAHTVICALYIIKRDS
jgi:Cupin-like domain